MLSDLGKEKKKKGVHTIQEEVLIRDIKLMKKHEREALILFSSNYYFHILFKFELWEVAEKIIFIIKNNIATKNCKQTED